MCVCVGKEVDILKTGLVRREYVMKKNTHVSIYDERL